MRENQFLIFSKMKIKNGMYTKPPRSMSESTHSEAFHRILGLLLYQEGLHHEFFSGGPHYFSERLCREIFLTLSNICDGAFLL